MNRGLLFMNACEDIPLIANHIKELNITMYSTGL